MAVSGLMELLSGRSILVVDDNLTNRRLLRLQFESSGMQVTEAVEAESALDLLDHACARDRLPDLVIRDYQMPGLDGVQFIRCTRSLPQMKALPVIVLSSVCQRDVADAARAAGAHAVLSKPVRFTPLARGMVEALGLQRGTAAACRTRAGSKELGLHVLLVEDNLVNQRVASQMLKRLGCTFTVAGDGAQACELSAAETFDMLLMDCQMPVMDGFSACRAIRQREGEARRIWSSWP